MSASLSSFAHLVVPGQVIASSKADSNDDENSFLRGHGTYVERINNEDRLIACVCGTVQRVNKLITVIPYCESVYQGHVGDLVVGRITQVQQSRWTVSLVQQQRDAQLPLSGVHLPGGQQRMRTTQDQREMRHFLQDGDLISAEIHKIQPSDGTIMLHTRSFRYTKLENGCLIRVPPALIPRRKNHLTTMIDGTLDVLWGTNGNIWIQRKLKEGDGSGGGGGDQGGGGGVDGYANLADLQEQIRQEHANTPVLPDERQAISRLRNSIECLRLVHTMVTPENASDVYNASLDIYPPSKMLLPENIIKLTESCRK